MFLLLYLISHFSKLSQLKRFIIKIERIKTSIDKFNFQYYHNIYFIAFTFAQIIKNIIFYDLNALKGCKEIARARTRVCVCVI